MVSDVIIYRPAKTPMQSGRANRHRWHVEYRTPNALAIEPLMGWTATNNPQAQLHLTFETKEAAIDYASTHGITYELIEPEEKRVIPKSYANNFM